MKTEKLNPGDRAAFIAYCLKHRKDIDDSFLYEKDLEKFQPDEENPTCIVSDGGQIIAAASLILDDYHRRGRNGRFRIFHSERADRAVYSLLLDEMLKYGAGLDKFFLFVPFQNKELAEILETLRFTVARYVFLLIRNAKALSPVSLPAGYSFRALQPGRDEAAWCQIRNRAFSQLKGNTTPVTPDMICEQLASPEYLTDGMIFLLCGSEPVGIIRCASDTYEDTPAMNIGPLAILPEYQGKGLGRQLLRTALAFAVSKGFDKTVLCVNAENESARRLYLDEGFVQAEGVTAYDYLL